MRQARRPGQTVPGRRHIAAWLSVVLSAIPAAGQAHARLDQDRPVPDRPAQDWLAGLPRFQPIDAGVQARALGAGINIMSQDRFFEASQGARFKDRYF